MSPLRVLTVDDEQLALRRLKLLLEYNGTRYHGWQIQPNAVTVQGTLEACLARLTRSSSFVNSSGVMSYFARHIAPVSLKPSSRAPLFDSSTNRA